MIWFKKIYFRIFGLILIVLMHQLGFAQIAPLKLKVVDNKNQSVAFANITIQMIDSATMNHMVADSNGKACFSIAICYHMIHSSTINHLNGDIGKSNRLIFIINYL